MTKEDNKKIKELTELRDSLYEQMLDINHQIDEIELSNFKDFQGKFIHHHDKGYMFVLWQRYNGDCQIYGGDNVILRGYSFCGGCTSFLESFWLKIYGLTEWVIPIKDYFRDCKSGEIEEISKEEFKAKLNKIINDISNNMNDMLDNAIKKQEDYVWWYDN